MTRSFFRDSEEISRESIHLIFLMKILLCPLNNWQIIDNDTPHVKISLVWDRQQFGMSGTRTPFPHDGFRFHYDIQMNYLLNGNNSLFVPLIFPARYISSSLRYSNEQDQIMKIFLMQIVICPILS
jgi:hypothetical protein